MSEIPEAPKDSAARLEGVEIAPDEQKPPLKASVPELKRMFEVIEKEILPKTQTGNEAGNKVFGASVLNNDLSTVVTETNAETDCPLFHGEVKCIYEWSKLTPADKRGPKAQESVFLSTHEPCCMCISSILWSGFTKVYYFFPYNVTAAQGIPHDIRTMHELWGVNTYRKTNSFLSTACLIDLVKELPDDSEDKHELEKTIEKLLNAYEKLSNKYHMNKGKNAGKICFS
jgi:tRNA(Arg) A34 adenosine deaminase TadA